MEDQLISFDTAKLAKEKGLTYDEVGQSYSYNGEFTYGRNDEHFYPAPTQSVLQKWLREKHKIHIIVNPTVTNYWASGLCNIGNELISISGIVTFSQYDYNTYEEALEAGLIDSLNLL